MQPHLQPNDDTTEASADADISFKPAEAVMQVQRPWVVNSAMACSA